MLTVLSLVRQILLGERARAFREAGAELGGLGGEACGATRSRRRAAAAAASRTCPARPRPPDRAARRSGSPRPRRPSGRAPWGWSSKNETVVAKSYMNHEKPQSSKSMTRTCGPVDEQVGEPDVRMHQAEPLGSSGRRPRAGPRIVASSRPSRLELLGAHAEPVLPAAPVARSAERRVVVPREAPERRRPRPPPRVAVHLGRDRAEGAESLTRRSLPSGSGISPGEPLEEHDVALAQLGRRELRHSAAVAAGHGVRRLHDVCLGAARRSSRARTRSRPRCGSRAGGRAARTSGRRARRSGRSSSPRR